MEHYHNKSWVLPGHYFESKNATKHLFPKVSFPTATNTITLSLLSLYINLFWVAQSQHIDGCSLQFPNKSHIHPTAQQNAIVCGPARQMGAGAGSLSVFAMRTGRVVNTVVRNCILPVAKHLGKKLPLYLKLASFWRAKRDPIAKC